MRIKFCPLYTGVLLSTLALAVAGVCGQSGEEGTRAPARAKSDEPDSRFERLLEERRKKLATVKPAQPSKVVELLATIENDGFDQIVSVQKGHWRFGFGKISPVSGGTPAIQYERPRLGGSGVRLRTAGAYSFRGYQAYDFRLGWFDEPARYRIAGSGFVGAAFDFDRRSQKRPRHLLYADVHYHNLPSEEFFGLGPDSFQSDRTNYHYEDLAFDAVAGLQPVRWLGFQFRAGHLSTDVGPGQRETLGDTQEVFAEEDIPGLTTQPEFVRLESALYLVSKGDPNLPGGEIGVSFSRFEDLDIDRFAFNRFSMDVRGTLPLGSRQRVLAARVFASRDYADEGQDVPFYLMETLGGHDTLRGYRDFRFRDTNVLYMSAEYRWEAAAGIELAAFYDTGKVFPDRSSFTFEHLRHSFGVGIRGKSMDRVNFRLEIGRSEEGTLVFLSLGPAF